MVEEHRKVAIHVTGRVQGVGFRHAAMNEARRIGVAGWVRNQVDGSVRAEVAGTASQVEAFVRWCREGPARARVDDVRVRPIENDSPLPDPFDVRR